MFARLEQSAFGETVRSVPYLYAALETLHFLGVALLLDATLAMDLRLLDVGRGQLAVTLVSATLHRLPASASASRPPLAPLCSRASP